MFFQVFATGKNPNFSLSDITHIRIFVELQERELREKSVCIRYGVLFLSLNIK